MGMVEIGEGARNPGTQEHKICRNGHSRTVAQEKGEGKLCEDGTLGDPGTGWSRFTRLDTRVE